MRPIISPPRHAARREAAPKAASKRGAREAEGGGWSWLDGWFLKDCHKNVAFGCFTSQTSQLSWLFKEFWKVWESILALGSPCCCTGDADVTDARAMAADLSAIEIVGRDAGRVVLKVL